MELSSSEAKRSLIDMMRSVMKETGYDIITDFSSFGIKRRAFCVNTPDVKKIGLDMSWLDEIDRVSEFSFVATVISLYHEVQHMRRYDELNTGEGDTLLMALCIADNVNQLYYLTNYHNNIRELDAEMHGIERAHMVLQTLFGSDADEMVRRTVLGVKRRATPERLYYGVDVREDDSVDGMIRRFAERIEAIRNGTVPAADFQFSENDPAFRFVSYNAHARRAFQRIDGSEFELATEFVAAASIAADPDIRTEFPENGYLQKLELRNVVKKIHSRKIMRRMKFARKVPDKYKSLVDASQRCVDIIANEAN